MNNTVQRLREEMLSREQNKDVSVPGADYRTLREHNHLLVLSHVRQGPMARVSIAQQTGLSKTTVSSIIDKLLQDGLVLEGDFLDSSATGGRRPILVQFNAEAGLIIGIEMGFEQITLVATNLAGEVKAVLTEIFDLTLPPASCISMLLASIQIFLSKTNITWEQIIGIGVGIAASLDMRSHHLLRSPSHHRWDGIDIPALLTQEFKVPTYIDSSANLGALSESRYGSGKELTDFMYVRIGNDISCGIISDRQIYHGAFGAAGELGHLLTDENGPLCSCGKQGCLNAMANSAAIIADAIRGTSAAEGRGGKRSIPTPRLSMEDEVAIDDVIHAADGGDVASRAALQTAGKRIGYAIASLITLMNPQGIVVDGYAVRTSSLMQDALRAAAARATMPSIWTRTRVVTGQLGDLAVALGAAGLVIDEAFTSSSLMVEP